MQAAGGTYTMSTLQVMRKGKTHSCTHPLASLCWLSLTVGCWLFLGVLMLLEVPATWGSSLEVPVKTIIFYSPLPSLLKISGLVSSLSLMALSKSFHKRLRAEVEILKCARSSNWSINSPILYEGRKEENEASVFTGFYLLNLCLFSIWDNMVTLSHHLTNQADLRSKTSPVACIKPSRGAHPLLCCWHVCGSTHTQLRGHHVPGTSGWTWACAMELAEEMQSPEGTRSYINSGCYLLSIPESWFHDKQPKPQVVV